MNTLKQQYMHPNWQKRRLEIMSLAGFECQNCGDTSIDYAIGFIEGMRFVDDPSIERIRLESYEQVDGFTFAFRAKNTNEVCALMADGFLETAKLGPY